jgi:uncharacterized membrane protein YheB (UPF0754 family)
MSQSVDDKRKLLGNLMFYRVQSVQSVNKDLVPKITGMLIDLEVLELDEVIEILSDDKVLEERINDAIAVIEEDEPTQGN